MKQSKLAIHNEFDIFLFISYLKNNKLLKRVIIKDIIEVANEEISILKKTEEIDIIIKNETTQNNISITKEFNEYKNSNKTPIEYILNGISDELEKDRLVNLLFHKIKTIEKKDRDKDELFDSLNLDIHDNSLLQYLAPIINNEPEEYINTQDKYGIINKFIEDEIVNSNYRINRQLRTVISNTRDIVQKRDVIDFIEKNKEFKNEIKKHFLDSLSKSPESLHLYKEIKNDTLDSQMKILFIFDALFLEEGNYIFLYLLDSIKKTWSTKKHRLKQGAKKPFTTTLLPETKDKLDDIVNRGTQSISDTLTRIINEEHERLLRKR